ncbi:NAD(P)/FAD-dependent oxidoreductase [Lachnospiraceae bacterium ZAX-1]
MCNKYDVIVVGAGASGLMAAISAARTGAKVAILEHMEQPGKKILSTGNGKCNFTNQEQGAKFYRGNNPAFVLPIFDQFGLLDTLAFFKQIGIYPTLKRGSYYYPFSEQASAIREVLLLEIAHLCIALNCNIGIRSIKKEGNTFLFKTKQGIWESRSCILATGGKSYKKTGSDGSGIPYIVGFSHHIIDIVPALVGLQGEPSFFRELAGIRANSVVSMYIENTLICEEFGEVQLTDYGVSGIPVFQVSRFASKALKAGKKVSIHLNFLSELTFEELYLYLIERYHINGGIKTAKEALCGLLNSKLISKLLQLSGIDENAGAVTCKEKELKKLAFTIQNVPCPIYGTKSFEFAQVSAGGVDTQEINEHTLESLLVKQLFFAGEVLDIDGMCGGYNLQWAWSSGWVAGHHAGLCKI